MEAAPACQNPIWYCKNCHYNKDSGCKDERTFEGMPVLLQEAACLDVLQGDPDLYAVVYSYNEVKCYTFNCNHTQMLTHW